MAPPIKQLEKLGYRVGVAHSDPDLIRNDPRYAEFKARLAAARKELKAADDKESKRLATNRVKAWEDELSAMDDAIAHAKSVPTVYAVSHDELGLVTHLADDATEVWEKLADSELHAKRLEVARTNGDPEDPRMLRINADGEVEEISRPDPTPESDAT